MKIGVLTAGGDCPGLNGVIRAVVRVANETYESSVIGFQDGWKGLIDNSRIPLVDDEHIDKVLWQGGTILGTGRLNPNELRNSLDKIKRTISINKLDALIPIGGEGTLTAAQWLSENGVNIVGVPKTIDNDVNGTDVTFGFDTAVSIATEAIDRLHTTAESHKRVMIVEVMGREVGWIALNSGTAGGAHQILIPEVPFDFNEVCELIEKRFSMGETYCICVVAEGAKPKEGTMEFEEGGVDKFGHRIFTGIGQQLGMQIQNRIPHEVRTTVLGHIQRGGTPTSMDRILATRFGIHAVTAVQERDFGKIVAVSGDDIVRIPISKAIGELKKVPRERYSEAQALFG